MSEVDRGLSESSDEENFRFFQNISPTGCGDEKLRGGEIDLQSELINSDPNVFVGQQFSKEELRLLLLVILTRGSVLKNWLFSDHFKNHFLIYFGN
jgi:hypothetical protein